MNRFPGVAALAVMVCGIAVFWSAVVGDPPPVSKGSRPQSVAVGPDGATVLATSMGSGFMSQIRNSVRTHIDVGAPSWGVCFLTNLKAVVTHPNRATLTVLTRASAS